MKAIILGTAALSLFTISAFGADLGVAPAPLAPPQFTWTGCYAGLSAGGGFGQKDLTDTAGVLSPLSGFTSANLDTSGYLLGGQIGCDYQFASSWVLGIEGSAWGGNIGAKTNVALTVPGAGAGDNATFKETTDLLTSLTARAGYAWDHWLLYGKGGVALVDDRYSAPGTFFGAAYDLEGLETRLGWTAGVGVEWAVSNDWSVKLEYDYFGFGTRGVTFIDQISGTSGPEEIKQNIQTIMLGVNMHVSAWQ
jgi:outer membrane immunogenic protein